MPPQPEALVSRLLALVSRDPPRPQELEAEAAVADYTPQGLASAWGKLGFFPWYGSERLGEVSTAQL